MRLHPTLPLLAILVAGASTARSQAKHDGIEQMPVALETRLALSALPPDMRGAATVYVLDVNRGYSIGQQGKSGVGCLVQRTAWEQAEFRDDIYVPRCFDAAGARTYLKVLIDAEALRIQGMKPDALKGEIEQRYRSKRYKAPAAGVSYMLSPLMRTWMPDDKVHTLSGPHVMFYAPNVTAADIGTPAGASTKYPFVTEEGVAEQTFIIQLIGDTERAAIVAEAKPLLDELCAYRAVLCLAKPGAR
jgi:hypothetical protein